MNPIDDRIMEILYASGLILSPSIIAYNIDYSRDEVNRRLGYLTEVDLVEKVDRGKYGISPLGEDYLAGDLDARELDDPTEDDESE